MTKMTYVTALNTAIQNLRDAEGMAEVVEKLEALRDQQVKRNCAERKPTKTQLANLSLADEVRAVLAQASEPLTITELMARSEVLAPLSNQKVSAIVRGMGADVVRVTDKRVSKFRLA